MITRHTPGPWIVKEQGDANEFCVMHSGNNWLLSFRQNGEKWFAEQKANATLIAAAPNLLEALQLAEATIERLNRNNSADGTLHVIREALAKATTA